MTVKSTGNDPANFPVAQTYTATYPSAFNFAAYPNYGTFPTTYSPGAFPYNYFPFYTNPVVSATNFKPVEVKERTKRSTSTQGFTGADRTVAIQYANPNIPATVIPNVFPTSNVNSPVFSPTTYTSPFTYSPYVTPYVFPTGVPNPTFINPYPFVYASKFDDDDDK